MLVHGILLKIIFVVIVIVNRILEHKLFGTENRVQKMEQHVKLSFFKIKDIYK
jgi:hypothetical protein